MKNIIGYLKKLNRRAIAPIGNCEKDFEFLCMDNVEFAKAMGFKTFYVGDCLEKVEEGYMTSPKQLEDLKKNIKFDYTYFEKQIVSLLELKMKSHIPIGGGCFGPLTIASDIMGVGFCNRAAIKQPEFLETVVDFITNYIIELALKEQQAGADFFWIAEPLASLFSPEKFWQFSGKYLKRISVNIGVAVFLHVCGKTTKHTPQMVETGAEVLSIDFLTDVEECIKMVPSNVVIMGNINPMLLLEGSEEEITHDVMKLNYSMREYDNFIFSSGCLIPWKTPERNIKLMIELTKEFIR